MVTKATLYIIVFMLMISCKNDHYQYSAKPQAGIFLSFDDTYIDEWFSLRDLFLKYDARVTFFISNFESLTSEEIDKLKILQHDGHEIGFHGAMHVVSEHYIKKHSIDQYLEKEIIAGIQAMNKKELYPRSFAYPYGSNYWGTDRELLKYFYVLRSVSSFEPGQDITKLDDIYYTFDGQRLLSSLSIDKSGNVTVEDIMRALTKCKNNKEVLMLFGHTPIPRNQNLKYTFDTTLLEQILKFSKEQNLKFFCASDLVITNSK